MHSRRSFSLTKEEGADLDRIIPFRFYGDGCEAMRILVWKKNVLLLLQYCYGEKTSNIFNHELLFNVLSSFRIN